MSSQHKMRQKRRMVASTFKEHLLQQAQALALEQRHLIELFEGDDDEPVARPSPRPMHNSPYTGRHHIQFLINSHPQNMSDELGITPACFTKIADRMWFDYLKYKEGPRRRQQVPDHLDELLLAFDHEGHLQR